MKNYLITGIVSLVVTLVVVAVIPRNVVNQVSQLGSVASPDIMSPYYSVGGVRTWKSHSGSFNNSSTTICSFTSPSATSTLVYGDVQITTPTTSAIVVDMAQSSVMDATTSPVSGVTPVAAGAQITIVASSTAAGSALIFGPNQRFNVKYGGTNGSLNSLAGSCNAVWVEN